MIDFIKKRRLWYFISTTIIMIGLIGMVNNYRTMNHIFNLGIDFTGGTSIILRFDRPVENPEFKLRDILNGLNLEKHTIQTSGTSDLIIKTEEMDVQTRNQLFERIERQISSFDILEVDIIGPSIGDQLKKTSFIIVMAVAAAILIYCSWRFEFIFGLASIVALLHDALIIMVVSALFEIEINTAFIAALLTVLGYSINDTIVIFDRIREKFKVAGTDEISKFCR
ncbi:MAG: protein translocase subunit SecF [Candidatus Margulisiibacteriota bacterium]